MGITITGAYGQCGEEVQIIRGATCGVDTHSRAEMRVSLRSSPAFNARSGVGAGRGGCRAWGVALFV